MDPELVGTGAPATRSRTTRDRPTVAARFGDGPHAGPELAGQPVLRRLDDQAKRPESANTYAISGPSSRAGCGRRHCGDAGLRRASHGRWAVAITKAVSAADRPRQSHAHLAHPRGGSRTKPPRPPPAAWSSSCRRRRPEGSQLHQAMKEGSTTASSSTVIPGLWLGRRRREARKGRSATGAAWRAATGSTTRVSRRHAGRARHNERARTRTRSSSSATPTCAGSSPRATRSSARSSPASRSST
jgi:hypothetical protein